jgi:hypothetical protein
LRTRRPVSDDALTTIPITTAGVETPLSMAMDVDGNPDTVRCLLDNGADVHAKNDWAIEVAAINGRQETVVVLVAWMFRELAWKGRLPIDVLAESERLAAKLENSVSLDDCKGDTLPTRAMVGAAAAVAVIMDCGSAAAERLRGPRK